MRAFRVLFLIVLSLPVQSLLAAPTIQQLLENGEFQVNVRLDPEAEIVPGQEIHFFMELATNRWFTSGTRMEIPEMDSMLVVQRENFAVNSSRHEDGQSWGVQTWELSLFPQRVGIYQTPPVMMNVTVNHEVWGAVTGNIRVPSLEFEASIPAEMNTLNNWTATSSLTVERSFDKPLNDLVVGDALQARIVIKGEKLLAMMLPEYQQPAIDGLAAYPKAPKLVDRQQRGEQSAERIEVIDYIVEQGGSVSFPEQVFHWWNTETGSPEMVTLPAVEFEIAGGAIVDVRSLLKYLTSPLVVALVVIGVLGGGTVFLLRRRVGKRDISERVLLRRIRRAVVKNDAEQTCRWLYVWLDQYSDQQSGRKPDEDRLVTLRSLAVKLGSPMFASQLENVLASAYAEDQVNAELSMDMPGIRRRWLYRILRRMKPAEVKLRLDS